MAMIAGGEQKNLIVKRGIAFLLNRQKLHGSWYEDEFTGTGFPIHFFIKYHMYQHFFPLMALGKYRSSLRHLLAKENLIISSLMSGLFID